MTFAENGDLVTGDSNGNIFIWSKGEHAQVVIGGGGIFWVIYEKCGMEAGETAGLPTLLVSVSP